MPSAYTVRKSLGQRIQRARLRNKDFTLISNDCWGLGVYNFLGLLWNTPFMGLYLMADDYLEMLSNLQFYLSDELVFIQTSRHESVNRNRQNNPYPIGLLRGKVEVQFLHYHSEQEVMEKWPKRVKRINYNNLVVKFDGSKDGATDEHISRFTHMKFRKLLFLKERPAKPYSSAVVIENYSPNGLEQFNISMAHFDLVQWLNTGQVKTNSFYRILQKLFVIEN